MSAHGRLPPHAVKPHISRMLPLIDTAVDPRPAKAGEDAKARQSLERALKLHPKAEWAGDAKKVLSSLVY